MNGSRATAAADARTTRREPPSRRSRRVALTTGRRTSPRVDGLGRVLINLLGGSCFAESRFDPKASGLSCRRVVWRRASKRLRRGRVKAMRQHNLYKILPFRWMARDMPFPMNILDEDGLSSGDTPYLSVARFKLDLAIQPNGKESTRWVMKVRLARPCRDMNKTNSRSFVESGTRGFIVSGRRSIRKRSRQCRGDINFPKMGFAIRRSENAQALHLLPPFYFRGYYEGASRLGRIIFTIPRRFVGRLMFALPQAPGAEVGRYTSCLALCL